MDNAATHPPGAAAIDASALSRRQFWRKLQLVLLLAAAVGLMAVSAPLFPDGSIVRGIMEGVGIFLIAGAVFGRLWSALYIGGRKKLELVRAGPYAAVRNPLYVATLAGVLGVGLVFGSLVVAFGSAILCFVIFNRIVRSEEEFLGSRFGSAYAAYAAQTPRWWPDWSRIELGGHVTVDVAVVLRTMREALIFFVVLGAQPLLTLYDESGALPSLFVLP